MNEQQTNCTEGLSLEMLERVGQVLRMLAHPHRLKMVEYLEQHEEAPVHDLADYVSLSPAATSQHLNHMKRLGLVASDRKGKEVWYAIADRRCISILNCIRAKGRKQSHG